MLTISSVFCVPGLFWQSMRGSADVRMFSLSVSLVTSRRLHRSTLATSVCALRLATAFAAREMKKKEFSLLVWRRLFTLFSIFATVSDCRREH